MIVRMGGSCEILRSLTGLSLLLLDHGLPAIRAGPVDAAPAGDVRDFLPALRADAVSARAGSRFVAAALSATLALARPAATTLASTAGLNKSVLEELNGHE
jgi:hypothetical protein